MTYNKRAIIFLLNFLSIHVINLDMYDHRQKSSGAEGERLKEATNINKSLSTLGCAVVLFLPLFDP